jgi:hypothetical protein
VGAKLVAITQEFESTFFFKTQKKKKKKKKKERKEITLHGRNNSSIRSNKLAAWIHSSQFIYGAGERECVTYIHAITL